MSVLVVALLFGTAAAQICFPECFCVFSVGLQDCQSAGMLEFPPGNDWTTTLDLRTNALTSIPTDLKAVRFPSLRRLDVRKNPEMPCVNDVPGLLLLADCFSGRDPNSVVPLPYFPPSLTTVISTLNSTTLEPDAALTATNIVYASIGVGAIVLVLAAWITFLVSRCKAGKKAQAPAAAAGTPRVRYVPHGLPQIAPINMELGIMNENVQPQFGMDDDFFK